MHDNYFPPEYQHATWHRLAPFFRLPGQVTNVEGIVRVELRGFNDGGLNRDLVHLHERVEASAGRLPDGHRLFFVAADNRGLPAAPDQRAAA